MRVRIAYSPDPNLTGTVQDIDDEVATIMIREGRARRVYDDVPVEVDSDWVQRATVVPARSTVGDTPADAAPTPVDAPPSRPRMKRASPPAPPLAEPLSE